MNKETSIPNNLLTVHGKEVEAILYHAVREALLRHKKLGQSVAVWRDGKVVILSPEEIPVEDSPDSADHSIQQS